jgi:hypothetical protein
MWHSKPGNQLLSHWIMPFSQFGQQPAVIIKHSPWLFYLDYSFSMQSFQHFGQNICQSIFIPESGRIIIKGLPDVP